MNRFVKKSVVAILFMLTIHLAIIVTADGTIDPFYLRFTTPQQSSLIIGTSRAAQTFQPAILNEALSGSTFDLPIFNFSFTLTQSPYGPVYLEAIKKKLQPNHNNGLFIMVVDPWPVCSREKDQEDPTTFTENTKLLGTMPDVNGTHPNWRYFFSLDKGIGKLVTSRIEYALTKAKILHKDGWLEITVPMDDASFKKRLKKKRAQFERNAKTFKFSHTRFDYMTKTVSYLKTRGKVVLVRLPVHSELLPLENQLVPNFDELIVDLAKKEHIQYINYVNIGGEYKFTDGSHIHKSSGALISQDVAKRIRD